MASIFSIMSYGGMTLAVISLIVAVILFIKWDIPKIFGDLTGRAEKKTIERIRREGYEMKSSSNVATKRKLGEGTIRVRKSKSEKTTLLTGNSSEEETTTVLNATSMEEEYTTVLNGIATPETNGNISKDQEVAGVIYLPEVKLTPMGTVEKVLDFIIAHTDEIVS